VQSVRVGRRHHFQEIPACPDDGRGRNGAIEGRKDSALLLGESEQIDIGKVPMADATAIEERGVAERDAVGPELVALECR
jgi:hypothetical protein